MLKTAYDDGAADALKKFKLEKTAVGLLPTALARGRQFLRGQAGGLAQLGQGLQGMLGPTANPAARGQAWQGMKTLAPSMAGLGASYLYSRGGDDQR